MWKCRNDRAGAEVHAQLQSLPRSLLLAKRAATHAANAPHGQEGSQHAIAGTHYHWCTVWDILFRLLPSATSQRRKGGPAGAEQRIPYSRSHFTFVWCLPRILQPPFTHPFGEMLIQMVYWCLDDICDNDESKAKSKERRWICFVSFAGGSQQWRGGVRGGPATAGTVQQAAASSARTALRRPRTTSQCYHRYGTPPPPPLSTHTHITLPALNLGYDSTMVQKVSPKQGLQCTESIERFVWLN